jgi:hypothetical protein
VPRFGEINNTPPVSNRYRIGENDDRLRFARRKARIAARRAQGK